MISLMGVFSLSGLPLRNFHDELFRAYPNTEHLSISCVEPVSPGDSVLAWRCLHVLRLVGQICADAGKTLASIGKTSATLSQKSARGRPRVNLRGVADGIYYLLRTGCQWKALPPPFGRPSTVHRYFQEAAQRGIFAKLWKHCLKIYDRRRGIAWNWQTMDGATTKSPLGGEKNLAKSNGSR